MTKRTSKSAQIRELLAAGWTPQQIVKKVKTAKLKDVYNVSYRLRKQEVEARPKRDTFVNAVPRDALDTKAEHDMTSIEWLRALRSKNDESTPALGVEITARIVLEDPAHFNLVEEVLEKAREYGAAEVTRQVVLVGDK